jgi:hypothetical protein
LAKFYSNEENFTYQGLSWQQQRVSDELVGHNDYRDLYPSAQDNDA